MTRKEYFGLDFYKKESPDGLFYPICRRHTVGIFSRLQVINYLNQHEINSLIDEIDNALNGIYFEEYFDSNGTGADEMKIVPPNIIINEDCIVSLLDMKGLLSEWLDFINS